MVFMGENRDCEGIRLGLIEGMLSAILLLIFHQGLRLCIYYTMVIG